MARYRYEELSSSQFEELVVDMCRNLLGASATGFAEGPDGGRDAKFEGTANEIPSHASPWSGITIVQAKHTRKVNASYTDADFLTNKTSVLNLELGRIKRLVEERRLDHYFLFSNRKMTGGAETKIKDIISAECSLPTADIVVWGVEAIDLELRSHPEIAERHGLDYLAAPLRITRDALANVIAAMKETLVSSDRKPEDSPVSRTPLKRKNVLNEVSDSEIEPLRKKYIQYTASIDEFLASPINEDLRNEYNEAVEELNLRLPYLIEQCGGFMGAWLRIYDILTDHEESLRRDARLVGAVQFYMYWKCDFGRRDGDADAEQTL